MTETLDIHFSPLVPAFTLWGMLALTALLFVVSVWSKGLSAAVLRAVVALLFMLVLASPSLREEEREGVKDVAVIIVDRSESQNFEHRTARTDKALAHLQEAAQREDNLDLRVVEVSAAEGELKRETQLFKALSSAFEDVAPGRRAGALLITDGQVHDVPVDVSTLKAFGPIHSVLSGSKHDTDRSIKITSAPVYGITGKTVQARLIVKDTSLSRYDDKSVLVDVTYADGTTEKRLVPLNQEESFDLPVEHAGQNVFKFSVEPLSGEMTLQNNQSAILVQGVRDRLKVLLVSGKPYSGGRTWRDLLTSDPSVDLVHFTILREPQKFDLTPRDDLALIPFPFRELFETKLYDFDLIIMDQYKLNRILPDYYFANIARYVREGGALLVVSGEEFASDQSILKTSLEPVIPGVPAGRILDGAFKPALSTKGKTHPVTRDLSWKTDHKGDDFGWGRWLRMVDMEVQKDNVHVLMTGLNEKPLMALQRIEEGRSAHIASDQIWLWSRGYEGGGPHAIMLRNMVHWLMKEPSLDELALKLTVKDSHILVQKPDYDNPAAEIIVTAPDGTQETVILERTGDGWLSAHVQASALGIYGFEDPSTQKMHFAVMGDINPPELMEVIATSEKLDPVADATGGAMIWLEDRPHPALGMRQAGARDYKGLGARVMLRKNGGYTVKALRETSLLPSWLAAGFLVLALLLLWWREGRH
jgi:hypothetical protein